MKILQVITSLRIGGAEKLITEISPLLRDRGHEVDVLAFDGIDTIFKKKYRIFRKPLGLTIRIPKTS